MPWGWTKSKLRRRRNRLRTHSMNPDAFGVEIPGRRPERTPGWRRSPGRCVLGVVDPLHPHPARMTDQEIGREPPRYDSGMRRGWPIWTFAALSALLLVMIIASRSYHPSHWQRIGESWWGIELGRGAVLLHQVKVDPTGVTMLDFSFGPSAGVRSRVPMHWLPKSANPSPGRRSLILPLWLLLVPSLGLTAWSWRRTRRPVSGRCGCGYDLAGVTTIHCPECGTAISRGRRPRRP